MKYKFKQFQFDCELQILTENGNIVALNEKAAQLVSLFVQEPDKIHTKSEILESVWTDKYVSEQVVFQNISQLRALFGSDVIKTFTKKGYKWQLPLEPVVEEPTHSKSFVEIQKTEVRQEFDKKAIPRTNQVDFLGKPKLFLLLTITFVFFSCFVFYHLGAFKLTSGSENTTAKFSTQVKRISFSDDSFLTENLSTNVSNQNLFDSPNRSWQTYAQKESDWLIATKFYQLDNNVVLRFHLQGAKRGWHDHIYAPSQKEAENELDSLLKLLSASRYFTSANIHSALAELTLLVNNKLDNVLLNQQIIKAYVELDDLDRALALVDLQLSQQHPELRLGLLYLLKGEIAANHRQWDVSSESNKLAVDIFTKLNLPHLEAVALIQAAWQNVAGRDFRADMQTLSQAISKARQSDEKLIEADGYITQSFLASKAGQVELSFTLIDLAREIVELHQLGDEHLIPIESNLGWISKSEDEKLKHYQFILDKPYSEQYVHFFYNAANRVRESHIKRRDWQQALSSIKPWQRDSFQSLARARVAFAQEENEQGIQFAQKAYSKAQIEHHKVDALDAALLLLENSHKQEVAIDNDEYEAFINQHATVRWIEQNNKIITRLSQNNG